LAGCLPISSHIAADGSLGLVGGVVSSGTCWVYLARGRSILVAVKSTLGASTLIPTAPGRVLRRPGGHFVLLDSILSRPALPDHTSAELLVAIPSLRDGGESMFGGFPLSFQASAAGRAILGSAAAIGPDHFQSGFKSDRSLGDKNDGS